jgi:hypothetical protein
VLRTACVLAAIVIAAANGASAQTFQPGHYRYTGADGQKSSLVVSNDGAGQAIAENWNLDLTKTFGCRLVLNYRSNVAVPANYDQRAFLRRELKGCAWTANECGFAACDSSTVTLNDGRYSRDRVTHLCAVYKTGTGDGVTEPACFSRVRTRQPTVTGSIGIQGVRIGPARGP